MRLWRVFIRQINSPFDALLIGVAVLALALHQAADAAIVLLIVAVSAALGTHNEYRAERTIEALRRRISRCANVVRGGEVQRIYVSALSRGDTVLLRAGDIVPADVRVTKQTGLEVDESALTGEALPVVKNDGDVAFMGTAVSSGTASAVVVALAGNTRFGEIAAHAAVAQPRTSFEKGLTRFAAMLLYITVVVSSAVFAVSLLVHRALAESLLFALAISVSLAPQLLPVIVSVSLSVGGYRLARQGAIVKKLVSIENLGNLDVLMTDKTGTLTTGTLAFETAFDAAGRVSEPVRLYGLVCNERTNALDDAIWRGSPKEDCEEAQRATQLGCVPFDYERRLMSVAIRRSDSAPQLIVKGAPEAVLERCNAVDPAAAARLSEYIASGARVVAVATAPFTSERSPQKSDEAGLSYAGALLFRDRDKPGVAAALNDLTALGVAVKVITGDHEKAARILCNRVGFTVQDSITGDELERLSDSAVRERLPQTNLFARISPIQKERIVRLQRGSGATVAFLGDGVNDVLALRAGDTGISVDSGADIAKEAADVVLTSKDLEIVVTAVREGRRIFANTVKYILMATSSNFGNMISAGIGSMLLPFLPLLPSQVLLNNMLYDTSEMTIPTDNVDAEALVRPEHWDLPLIRRYMAMFGPLSSFSDFAIFAFLLYVVHAGAPVFRSAFFIESFVTQALVVFLLRTRRVPFFRSKPSAQLVATTLLCAAAGVVLPFTPLAHILGFASVPRAVLGAIAAVVLVYAAGVELAKIYFFRTHSGAPLPLALSSAMESR